jgi:hypothetical protein
MTEDAKTPPTTIRQCEDCGDAFQAESWSDLTRCGPCYRYEKLLQERDTLTAERNQLKEDILQRDIAIAWFKKEQLAQEAERDQLKQELAEQVANGANHYALAYQHACDERDRFRDEIVPGLETYIQSAEESRFQAVIASQARISELEAERDRLQAELDILGTRGHE